MLCRLINLAEWIFTPNKLFGDTQAVVDIVVIGSFCAFEQGIDLGFDLIAKALRATEAHRFMLGGIRLDLRAIQADRAEL